MYRFWPNIFSPLLEKTAVKNILEIGSDRGYNTFQLVEYCKNIGGKLHVIDPELKYDWEKLEEDFNETLIYYHGLSIPVLQEFSATLDCAFIDGDHNWYSVYNELCLLHAISLRSDTPFPLTFLHDVCWPYARRDLYYNPSTIPSEFLLPHSQQGLVIDQSDLAEDNSGLNAHLFHAIHEGGKKNGVLTAVEDFLSEKGQGISFRSVPGLFGLGVIWSKQAPYAAVVENFLNDLLPQNTVQDEHLKLIERERLGELTRASEAQRSLTTTKKEVRRITRNLKSIEKELTVDQEKLSSLQVDMECVRAELKSEQRDSKVLRELITEYEQELLKLRQNILVRTQRALKEKLNLLFYSLQAVPRLSRDVPYKALPKYLFSQARNYATIKSSELFDDAWYREELSANDLKGTIKRNEPLILHYLHKGASAKLKPNPLFDTAWYLKAYPDVAQAGINPFVHYLRRGMSEGRFCDPLFDLQGYANANNLSDNASQIEIFRHALSHLSHSDATRNQHQYERFTPTQWAYSFGEEELRRQVQQYNEQKQNRTAKVVVFSANIGGYDTPIIPEKIVPEWDYVIFSDATYEGEHIFDVRPLPSHDFDARKMARYIKTHPEEFLGDQYDYCIWVDASILLRGDHLSLALKKCRDESILVMGNPHPHRKCVSEELAACIHLRKDNEETMRQQVEGYLKGGLPKDFGMIETGILIRKLYNEQVSTFNNIWWDEISNGSSRDQLSVTYALWKAGVQLHYLPDMKDIRIHGDNDYCLFPHRHRADCHSPAYAAPSFFGGESFIKGAANTSQKNASNTNRASITSELLPVDIVICVHNAFLDVKACLRSVFHHIQQGQKVILVDDGSAPETAELLQSYANQYPNFITLKRNNEAKGYTCSANIGLKLSDAPFRILLNSDTVVTARWAEKMYSVIQSNPRVGIVGPLSNAASWQSMPSTSDPITGKLAINDLPQGFSTEEVSSWCEENLTSLSPAVIPLINGFCYGITAQTLERVGYLDEEAFPRGYGEEDDLSLRAGGAGFQLAVALDTYVYHAKSKSFGGETRKLLAQQGFEALKKKHGEKRIKHAVRSAMQQPQLWKARVEFGRKFGIGDYSATGLQVASRSCKTG